MIKTLSRNKVFDGIQMVCSHHSKIVGCSMQFAIFIPNHKNGTKLPALYWLSGLTCTHENFITKAGAQRVASKLGLILVVPDTSPRGIGVKGEDDSIDFGTGAGFYLDATREPWSKNYKMYSYIVKELPQLLESEFPIDTNSRGIFGHSMGGHGALSIALKNPNLYKSVSAFSPICAPMQCPWGQKAFSGYLGSDKNLWQDYDSCELVSNLGWDGSEILVDQGDDDQFLTEQLMPDLLVKACADSNVSLNLRIQKDYDHSYYFIASFIEDHLIHHAKYLV
jgi:S-formylglutathione hydrolase